MFLLGLWSLHDNSYHCNRFVANVDAKNKELDRYFHYCNRFGIHKEAQSYAINKEKEIRGLVLDPAFSDDVSSTYKEVLTSAANQVVECRRVLKYTYIYAYYLKADDSSKDLFEYQQEMLEKNTEQLQEFTEEKEVFALDAPRVLNLVTITKRFMTSICSEIIET